MPTKTLQNQVCRWNALYFWICGIPPRTEVVVSHISCLKEMVWAREEHISLFCRSPRDLRCMNILSKGHLNFLRLQSHLRPAYLVWRMCRWSRRKSKRRTNRKGKGRHPKSKFQRSHPTKDMGTDLDEFGDLNSWVLGAGVGDPQTPTWTQDAGHLQQRLGWMGLNYRQPQWRERCRCPNSWCDAGQMMGSEKEQFFEGLKIGRKKIQAWLTPKKGKRKDKDKYLVYDLQIVLVFNRL